MKVKNKKILVFMFMLYLMPLIMSLNLNDKEIRQNDEIITNLPPFNDIIIKPSAPDSIIHVTGANWTWTVGNGTATGSGTFIDPYIIQDKVIDAGQAPYGIYIQNSDKYYFRIENCTVYNANIAGMLLSNANNGTIIRCNISNNADAEPTDNEGIGIWVSSSDNNTIIKNIVCNNSEYGIYMAISYDNIFQENIINNNSRHGVSIPSASYDNHFLNNSIQYNSYFGFSSSNGNDMIIRGDFSLTGNIFNGPSSFSYANCGNS